MYSELSKSGGGTAQISPADRLRRDEAARGQGKLLIAWTTAAALDENARARFAEAQQELLRVVAHAPPRERPGCSACPARCRMLPFIAGHDLSKVASQLTGVLTGSHTSMPEQMRILGQRLAPIERAIPLLSRHAQDTGLHRDWLYCLLTNLNVAPEAERGRDEILIALRELSARPDTGELLDIFGAPALGPQG